MKDIHDNRSSGEIDPEGPFEKLGWCPACGRKVVAGAKDYYCIGTLEVRDNRGTKVCSFRLAKNRLRGLGKDLISASEMKSLLDEESITLKNLRKKNGETFNCEGILEYNDQYGWGIGFIRYKIRFSPKDELAPQPKRLRPLAWQK